LIYRVNVLDGELPASGGWQRPKGEIYPSFPTVDELKKVYGM
jgi:hypothetical protein